jgi:signal transduction histidine kinase
MQQTGAYLRREFPPVRCNRDAYSDKLLGKHTRQLTPRPLRQIPMKALAQKSGQLRPLYAYLVAILGVATVIGIRYALVPVWGDRYPYGFFFIVLTIATWMGGPRPGLLAMVLGWFTVIWLMPHLGVFSPEKVADKMGHVLFIGQSILIIIGFSSMRHRIEVISNMQRAEAALEQSERELATSLADAELNLKRLKMIEGAVNAGTWEFDVGSGISHWPAGISSLWGLPPQDHEVSLDDFVSRIYSEDRERVVQTVQAAIATGDSYETEFRVVWPDRSVHWLSARGAILRDDAKNPRKIIGIALEATQRHQTEHALRESEKLAATGRMAATIAHEINNPLEAVVNLVYLAKNDPNLSPDTREYLANADVELARVSHMVRQTLGFYRENSSPAWMDASEMVQQITALYRNKIIRKNVQVDVRTEAAEVFAVEGELRQVISNLVSNAIDAVEMNGHIRIRVRKLCRANHTVVRIVVGDNGHGISPENRPKLFQPFFTTKASVGTGLGLWVSKGIIEKHNGRVQLRTSTSPGRNGTVFQVDFPVEQQASSQSAIAG